MTTPPDKYLQFLLNLFYSKMIEKTSEFYLPKLIEQQKDPTYEPYVINGEWTIEDDPSLLAAGCPICLATAPEDAGFPVPEGLSDEDRTAVLCLDAGGPICQISMFLPSAPPALTLTDPSNVDFDGKIPFVVAGLSNVLPSQPVVTSGEDIDGSATFSSVADWKHHDGITLTGNFILTQNCCMSTDGRSCTPGGKTWHNRGYGTFKAVLKSSSVKAQATAFFKGKALQVKVTKLDFEADPDTENLTLTADMLSIKDPNERKSWEATLQIALDAEQTRKAVVSNLQERLASEKVRQDFEKAINDALGKFTGTDAAALLTDAPEALRCQVPPGFEENYLKR